MRKYYNTGSDSIKNFLQSNPELFDGTIPNEKEIFAIIAKKINEIVKNNVYGFEGEIDYNGCVVDFYEGVWCNVIRPILTNNQKLLQELIDVESKSTPIYLVTKQN